MMKKGFNFQWTYLQPDYLHPNDLSSRKTIDTLPIISSFINKNITSIEMQSINHNPLP